MNSAAPERGGRADPADTALWCCGFELSGHGSPVGQVEPVPGQRRVRALVRVHGEPVGYVMTQRSDAGVDLDDLVTAAWSRFGQRIAGHLAEDGLVAEPGTRPGPATARCRHQVESAESVSVVVCTRNRAAMLPACLDALAALSYPHLEFVIVDNAPVDDSTRTVVEGFAREDPRFSYVVEPRPGLSRARNRGLVEATGRYLAYTDDDVTVDRSWIEGLLGGFQRRPDVACVTGLACSAGITSAAEAYFDARAASWSTRCEPDLFEFPSTVDRGPLYPYSAGIFGTGANFAFDRSVVVDLGGFDEALGAGTPTRGGEDLDMFVRILRAGRAIAYEPAAVAWHHHRADDAALLKQMYGYGTGLSAFITKLILSPDTRAEIARRVPGGLARLVHNATDATPRMEVSTAPPRGAVSRELRGLMTGPLLYLRSPRGRSPGRRTRVTTSTASTLATDSGHHGGH